MIEMKFIIYLIIVKFWFLKAHQPSHRQEDKTSENNDYHSDVLYRKSRRCQSGHHRENTTTVRHHQFNYNYHLFGLGAKCGKNEYSDFGVHLKCQESCEGVPKQCKNQEGGRQMGCVCNEGYVREKPTSKKSGRHPTRCIPKSECGKAKDSPECEANEYFDYGLLPNCQETCDGFPTDCFNNREPGCFCDQGYVRTKIAKNNKKREHCIPITKCPSQVLPYKCDSKKNEHRAYGDEPQCQETCEGIPEKCLDIFWGSPGCYCKAGYVRIGKTTNKKGRHSEACVPKYECKDLFRISGENPYTRVPTIHKCGENEHYDKGPIPACHSTCAGEPPYCLTSMWYGCMCNDGYVREKDTNTKDVHPERCIPEEKCPKIGPRDRFAIPEA